MTASAGVAGWIELTLLRRSLQGRVGHVAPSASYMLKLWTAAALAGVASRLVRMALPPLHPFVVGATILPLFVLLFVALSRAAGIRVGGRELTIDD